MGYYTDITQDKIEKLIKIVSKKLRINKDEAQILIYEEFDLVEDTLQSCHKIKEAANRVILEINKIYSIA